MDKNLKTTLYITISLFSFIIFLVYLLYCFAYYDKNQEELYFAKIENKKYDYIFDNMSDKDGLSKDKYDKALNMIFDSKNLKNIYYLYYKDSDVFELEDFLNKYYYGDVDIKASDVTYSQNGKTGLFTRRAIFYKSIDLTNKKGHKTSIGVKRNVSFKIEAGSSLKIDNDLVGCKDGLCNVSKIFGGLHEISYVSNGYEYYGLVNIVKDKQSIDVTNIDNLVRMDIVSNNDILKDDYSDVNIYDLKVGKYMLNKCYLSFGCPTKKKSYIQLNQDGTCKLYTYISLDQAGDLYNGTYTQEGNFLVMKFDGHTYQVFDYDTKQSTDITAEVDMEIRYKITENNELINDSYKFKFSE